MLDFILMDERKILQLSYQKSWRKNNVLARKHNNNNQASSSLKIFYHAQYNLWIPYTTQ